MVADSLDLRTRVLKDSDAGMASELVAEKYAVSRAWVDRLKQRRRRRAGQSVGASESGGARRRRDRRRDALFPLTVQPRPESD